ncbi:MAG: lysylphosphatidylglycerol synthase transmembrane domain-containing protein [candidate division WOR-3 bacterium]
MKNKTILRLGFVLSFVFLILVLRDFDVNKVWNLMKSMNATYLMAGVLIYFSSYLLRAIRWKFFFPGEYAIDTKSAIGSFYIGNFGNNIFPARLGDLWRIVLLHQRNETPKSLVLASTIVERIFDAIAILVSGLVAFSLSKVPSTYRFVLLTLFVLILLTFFIAWYLEERYESKIHFHPKIVWFFKNLKLALKPFVNLKKFTFILLITLISWGIELLSFYSFLKAFGIEASVVFLTLILFFINIAVSLPSAPSNIGTFEYGFVLAGQICGLDKSHILMVALVTHFLRFALNVVLGVIFSSIWHFKVKG